MTKYNSASLVVPYGQRSSGWCGYCKSLSPRMNVTWGMSAKRLTVSHYQYLIDHGWRRSGTYCYKPLNDSTCCPSYTIRCDALNFKLSRSQKRVLRAVNTFLKTGQTPQWKTKSSLHLQPLRDIQEVIPTKSESFVESEDLCEVSAFSEETLQPCRSKNTSSASPIAVPTAGGDEAGSPSIQTVERTKRQLSPTSDGDAPVRSGQRASSAITGKDLAACTSRRSEKARDQRWLTKLKRFERIARQQDVTADELKEAYFKRRQRRLDENRPKPLEYYFSDTNQATENKHFLEVRLVPSHLVNLELEASLSATIRVYQRYQVAVHGDSEAHCSMSQFRDFLVTSPLVVQQSTKAGDTAPSLGSYHQQYWLDGKQLIAVGVVDLLPGCLSSVYLFYDPAYAYLHLGTYSALREIAFVRDLIRKHGRLAEESARSPLYTNFDAYYMGYYIPTCPKMTYKAKYRPAFLTCPVTCEWVPIEQCLRMLAASDRCTRFSDPSGQTSLREVTDAEIDARLMCRVNAGSSGHSKARKADACVYSLAQLSANLRPRAVQMLRDWCRLIGEPALSGQLQVLID